MTHIRNLLVGAVVLTVIASPVRAKTFYFEMRANVLGPFKQLETAKGWEKSPAVFRIQSETPRGPVVMIANGADAWMYDAKKRKGFHQRVAASDIAMMNKRGRTHGNDLDEFKKAGAVKAGTDRVDGAMCDIYKLHGKDGSNTEMWVVQGADKLTKKVVNSGTMPLKGERGAKDVNIPISKTVLYTVWKTDVAMPDSLFKPPSNIKFQEAPAPANAGGNRK